MSQGDQDYSVTFPLRIGHYDVHPVAHPRGHYGTGLKLQQPKVKQGWVCPKCDSVYAPYIPECSRCNSNGSVG